MFCDSVCVCVCVCARERERERETMTSPADIGVRLDGSKDSLSLLSILRAFDGPINEERAWAVLHQAAKTAAAALAGGRRCRVVAEASQLWIHRDGHVHPASFQLADTGN